MSLPARDRLLALSVWQPWAYLIVSGQKTVELRSWPTNHRGEVVIHASRRVDEAAISYFAFDVETWPTGVALAVVQLVDVVTWTRQDLTLRRWSHRSWGPYAHGMRGFVFAAPRVLARPVEMMGSRGLFPVPDGAASNIAAQVGMNLSIGSGATADT